jgi:hypothetical protein
MVEFLTSFATVVCSSLSEASSQAEWELDQLAKIGQPRHNAIIILSSAYCGKVGR